MTENSNDSSTPKYQQLFCAVGQDGLRIVSEDGITWKHQHIGKEGETYRAVASGLGRIVIVGSYGGKNILAASTDGITWKTADQDAGYVRYIRGLGFGNKQFLGLGGDPGAVGDSKPFIQTTTDGIQWSESKMVGGRNMLRRITWGNDRFVAVGDRGRRSTSKDGIEWKDSPDVKAIDTLIDVAFGANVFVGVGLHGLRMTSVDGITWTDRQTGQEGEHLNSIFWAKDQFVAVGFGVTYFSKDGRQWNRQPNFDAPQTAAYGNGIYIGSSWKGRILRSTDAIQWKQVHKTEQHVEAVTHAVLS